MKKVRIGNTIFFRYSLYKGEETEDLTDVTVAACFKNKLYGNVIPVVVDVKDNTVSAVIRAKDQSRTGVYNFFLSYTKDEVDYALDVDAFELVNSSSKAADDATPPGADVETIELTGAIENGPAAGAIEQVQADWNETDPVSKAFIKNKPYIPSAAGGDFLFSVEGKRFIALGDSSTEAGGNVEQTVKGSWVQGVCDLLKLDVSSRNIARGGATWRDRYDTACLGDESKDNTLSNQVYSLVKYHKENPTGFIPDLIFIQCGGNDLPATYPYTGWNDFLGNWDTDVYDFKLSGGDYDVIDVATSAGLARYNALRLFRQTLFGACRWAVETLLHWFPNATIFIGSPLQRGNEKNKNLFTFSDALKRISAYYGLPFVNCTGGAGISYFTETRAGAGWGENWYTYDQTHKNASGNYLVSRYIAAEVQRLYFDKGTITAERVDTPAPPVTEGGRKCIVAMSHNGITFDAVTGINKIRADGNGSLHFVLYDTDKNDFGAVDIITAGSTQFAALGNTTGDNSGKYPDEYLNRNAQWFRDTHTNDNFVEFAFAVPAGAYTVRLFANSKADAGDLSKIFYCVNDEIKNPSASFTNNFTSFVVEFQNINAADGLITIKYRGSADSVRYVPLNVIEIEQIK